jgi:excisionase family DNA binding protein
MNTLVELFTPAETANLFKLKRHTIYLFAAEGRIPNIKIGRSLRFRRSDVEEVIAKGFRPAIRQLSDESRTGIFEGSGESK